MLRWPRQILFGDVDAMFASAAAVKDPTLTGKPIAVGGPPPRGIIAAASYAVRAFGVRSAMPTADALRRCPHLQLIPPDRPLYRRLHDDMRRVTDRLFPVTEWGSIDEFYADTTDLQTRHPDPRLLAQLVKDSIFEATGLRCTIAVATGKTVAKIAADASKPDGLAIVEPGREAAFLLPRPLRALPGIGPKTAARLEPFSIKTIGDFLDPRWDQVLARMFGHRLLWIRELAQGRDRGTGHRRPGIQEFEPRDHVRAGYRRSGISRGCVERIFAPAGARPAPGGTGGGRMHRQIEGCPLCRHDQATAVLPSAQL